MWDGPAGPAHTAAVVLDAQGVVTAWSPGAARLLGHRAQDVVGRPLKALLQSDGDGAAQELLTGGGSGTAPAVMRHEGGGGVGVELLRAPLADRDGAPGAGLLVITPLPGAERSGDPLVEMAFAQFPFAGGIHGPDLRYVRINDKGSEAWGRSPSEIVGRLGTDLMPDDIAMDIRRHMEVAMRTGESVYREDLLRMPGEPRDHAWAGVYTPLKDGFGQVKGLYSVGFDITEQHRARERLSLLDAASGRVGSTLDVETTARELAELLVPALADFVTVDLLDSFFGDLEPAARPPSGAFEMRRMGQHSVLPGYPESVLEIGEVEKYPTHATHARAVSSGRSFITRFDEDGKPDWTGDGRRLDASRLEVGRRFAIHSAMVVPLRARGTTLGVAVLLRHRTTAPFDTDDLTLAEEISDRAAMAMDNALRYSRQRHNALTLQNSLLPQSLPESSALDLAGRYLPSDAEIGVGGDWYDVIPLSGARVALVVGDVVGHGIHASAAMGRLRTAVRTLADLDMSPDEVLAHLDDRTGRAPSSFATPDEIAFGSPGAGATCLYAVYDPVTRTCAMARAGHMPPALVLPDGTAELIDLPAGPPLGLGGLPFETAEIVLPEGSLLALYTDGLVERRKQDVDEGIDRLLATLSELTEPARTSGGAAGENGPAGLERACGAVLGSLQAGGSEDDVALLLARTKALDPAQVATWELPREPEAAGRARDLAGGQLSEWGLEEAAFTTEIVVSELVTNAIRYGSGRLRLRLILEDSLVVEVTDGSNTYPRLRRARGDDEGGRGLLLVAQLSTAWGTRPSEAGKIVWAEQSLTTTGP